MNLSTTDSNKTQEQQRNYYKHNKSKENVELEKICGTKEKLVHESKETLKTQNNSESNCESRNNETKENLISQNELERKQENQNVMEADELYNGSLLPDTKSIERFSPLCRQTLSSIGSISMIITAGLTIGYSATLLPQLRKYKDIPINDETGSWIASIAALAMAPTCILGGSVIEKFGRRNTHFIVCGPFFLAWILIAMADNLYLILLGRFLTGVCCGFIGPLGSVFISETTSPQYRGLFLAIISLAIAIGIFITHFIGTWLHWQWAAVICSLFPIISVSLLAYVPESPVWLISNGKIEAGIKAFYWFRGYDEEGKLELRNMIDKYNSKSNKNVATNYLEMWMNMEFLKPLFVMFVFFVTVNFAGTNVFAFYSVEIIAKAVGKGVDKYLAMIIIDLIRLFMSSLACYVCKRYNRRTLCITSGVFTGLAMILLSLFLNVSSDREDLAWIPLCCLLLYICSLSIGLIPLPWIMCAELFPTRYRGQGSGLSAAIGFVASFIVVKIAPSMFTRFGEVTTFLIYGIIALSGTAILFFILPETNKKTLLQIEEGVKKKPNQV